MYTEKQHALPCCYNVVIYTHDVVKLRTNSYYSLHRSYSYHDIIIVNKDCVMCDNYRIIACTAEYAVYGVTKQILQFY